MVLWFLFEFFLGYPKFSPILRLSYSWPDFETSYGSTRMVPDFHFFLKICPDISYFPIAKREGTRQEREEEGLSREEKAISDVYLMVQGSVEWGK